MSAASLETSSDFIRVSTTVVLAGAGETGRGEDVGYGPDHQRRFQDRYGDGGLDLAGDLPTSPLEPPTDPTGFRRD